MMVIKLQKSALSLLPAAALFFFNETTLMQRLYDLYPNIDIPMHILGGMSIAFAASLLMRTWYGATWRALPVLIRIMLLIGVASFAGISWEWYEFIHDHLFHSHYQLSNADTMKDLLDDVIGGSIGALIFSRYDKK